MAKKTLNYSDSIQEIEEILSKIEKDDLDIDELSQNVKRVSQLIKFCKEKLQKTETEVEKVLNDLDED